MWGADSSDAQCKYRNFKIEYSSTSSKSIHIFRIWCISTADTQLWIKTCWLVTFSISLLSTAETEGRLWIRYYRQVKHLKERFKFSNKKELVFPWARTTTALNCQTKTNLKQGQYIQTHTQTDVDVDVDVGVRVRVAYVCMSVGNGMQIQQRPKHIMHLSIASISTVCDDSNPDCQLHCTYHHHGHMQKPTNMARPYHHLHQKCQTNVFPLELKEQLPRVRSSSSRGWVCSKKNSHSLVVYKMLGIYDALVGPSSLSRPVFLSCIFLPSPNVLRFVMSPIPIISKLAGDWIR